MGRRRSIHARPFLAPSADDPARGQILNHGGRAEHWAVRWIARGNTKSIQLRRASRMDPGGGKREDDAAKPSCGQGIAQGASPSDSTRPWPTSQDGNRTIPQFCSAEPVPPECVPPNPRDHPRYRILGRLGHGGMGDVFLAEHRLMGRRVALKTIGLVIANSPNIGDRFLRESRATAKLSHPNVVVAHDAEATEDQLSRMPLGAPS
jgi:hypothetical protein